MSTWLSEAKLYGYYDSPNISLSLDGDGALSAMTWQATTPTNTSVTIFTSVSYDNAVSWSEWKQCINGGRIPDISPRSPLGNALLRYRVFISSLDPAATPFLDSITFNFEPVIVFMNDGDANCKPEIWITKVGNGDFTLVNTSLGNEEFKFTSLIDGETVYVNSDREDIQTTLVATYRYSNFNDNYLDLPVGENVFRVIGNAKIQFRYQYKLIQ